VERELLIKAAGLCRQAAERLRAGDTPEKQASEIATTMVSKGLIPSGERERYSQYLQANPEKIASMKESIASLPARVDAIGELSSMPVSGSKDAMDSFIYN
jgi:hypothetical protein